MNIGATRTDDRSLRGDVDRKNSGMHESAIIRVTFSQESEMEWTGRVYVNVNLELIQGQDLITEFKSLTFSNVITNL